MQRASSSRVAGVGACLARALVPVFVPVFALALAPVLGGCGDLSQEDLLFRAAIPARDAVAVAPPGSDDDVVDGDGTGQALTATCDDGDVRCEAAQIARRLNALTFGLLDIVDAIADRRPTFRAVGRRVWGPVFNDRKDQTFRFEMARSDDDASFTFCLHVAKGDASDVAPDAFDCAARDDDRGLVRVLDGAFAPDDLQGGARDGVGTMTLDVEALARLGGGDRFASQLVFAFDNRDDASDLHIDLVGPSFDASARAVGYDYARDAAGAGSFAFVLSKNVAAGPRAERVQLLARWTPEQSGRGVAVVDGGDLSAPVTPQQCWDASLATVFVARVDGTTTGDETRCALAADDVVSLP